MRDEPSYDVVVVGAGPGGLTTAMYTTRLGHPTALVNREGGRYTRVHNVHNVIGICEQVSGADVTNVALAQLEEYGADYYAATVTSIERIDGDYQFRVRSNGETLQANRVVLATGFDDRTPDVPGLKRFTGTGLHYCLHCDAFTLIDEPVFVMGHDQYAAEVAMLMCNFTADVDLVRNGVDPTWDDDIEMRLRAHPIDVIDGEIERAYPTPDDPDWLGGFEFADGSTRDYKGGFAMYGADYNTELAIELDCDRTDDGAIEVDDEYRTSVDGVYAVGDVTHGQNQTPVAMGDGTYAGIAIHRDLRTFPLSLEEVETGHMGNLQIPGTPESVREHARKLNAVGAQTGMRPPWYYE